MQRIAISFSLLLLVASAIAHGSEPVKISQIQLDLETLHKGDNEDGSCVQCSITHLGYHCNEPAAALLLVDSQYGPAVRGGSTPTRVANYCNQRHIKAWNITGMGDGVTTGTRAWMRYAAKTGRFAAIGFTRKHFETYAGEDYEHHQQLVINNQLPSQMRTDRYDEAEFMRRHLESGPWIVVLQKPGSENPKLQEWWK